MDLTVLIPAINEADNLSLILPQIHEVLRRERLSYEILVIDGGSTDDTVTRAAYHGALVHGQSESGYGGALKEGFRRARGRHILTMDADYSHDPFFLMDLYRARDRGAIVVGSRYVPGGSTDGDAFRTFLSRILNFTFRRLLSLPIRDLSSGFRLYDRAVLPEVPITARHFEALEEILIRTYGLGYAVHEIPFHYRAREKGVSKARILKFGWRLLKTLLKLWSLRNQAGWADYDDRAFDSRVFLQRYWQRTRHRIVMELLGRPGLVLDIGCGSSRIIQTIPGAIGMDVHHPKLRYIRNRGCRGVRGSVYTLPFPDASFDQAIFSQVIEHIPPKPQILGEIRRVLKPGGVLVIGTPDYSRLFWVVLEFFYDVLAPGAYGHEHISHYSLKTLRRHLEESGFRFERALYVGGGELNIRAVKE